MVSSGAQLTAIIGDSKYLLRAAGVTGSDLKMER
jgi:hypothetical protein